MKFNLNRCRGSKADLREFAIAALHVCRPRHWLLLERDDLPDQFGKALGIGRELPVLRGERRERTRLVNITTEGEMTQGGFMRPIGLLFGAIFRFGLLVTALLVAGCGGAGGGGGGAGALFSFPTGVATDSAGNVYGSQTGAKLDTLG
jgi:hypothetical protein